MCEFMLNVQCSHLFLHAHEKTEVKGKTNACNDAFTYLVVNNKP